MRNRYGADAEMYSDTESSPESTSDIKIPKRGNEDLKVGDTVTFTVTGIYDDSITVAKESSAPEEETEDESEAQEMAESESPELAGPAPTESEMAAMMG